MRQLSGMGASLSPLPTASTAPTAATVSNMNGNRPVAAAGGFAPSAGAGSGSAAAPGAGFDSAFRQIQQDVNQYIAGGDGGFHGGGGDASAGSAQAMTLQAMALRQRAGGGAGTDAVDGGDGVDGATQQQFLASIQPWAEEAAGKLGVSPQLVAAHAALESAWGKQPLRQAGVDSNNLFGLKAGAGWQGAVAAATTTEYEHGAALKKTERFRAYPDTASAFRDYADMLTSNPRYQAALNTGTDARAFASGLAKGGYATDPAYADKLSKLAARLQHGGAAVASAVSASASVSASVSASAAASGAAAPPVTAPED